MLLFSGKHREREGGRERKEAQRDSSERVLLLCEGRCCVVGDGVNC